jgi:ribosomal protein L37AE/L43A
MAPLPSRQAKAPELKRPELNRNTQYKLWKLADSLARALRSPSGEIPGDPRWTVSGVANSVWQISHPDLEILESGDSPLRLRLKKISQHRWGVFGQNQLKNLENNKVIAIQPQPPGPSWDIDAITNAASQYFQDQKELIDQTRQEMTPDQPPGTGGPAPQAQPPGMGGPPMPTPPTGSRRASATLSNLRRAQAGSQYLNRKYAQQSWYGHTKVINDRLGVALATELKSVPPPSYPKLFGTLPVIASLTTPPKPTIVRLAGKGRTYKITRPHPEYRHRQLARTLLSLQQHPISHDHNSLVSSILEHISSRSRPYSSIRGLAKSLSRDSKDVARAVGQLVADGTLDVSSGYLRATKTDRAASSNRIKFLGSVLHDRDSTPPCPSCGSQKTNHVRSLKGNAICQSCGQVFRDPEYGKKTSSWGRQYDSPCPKCGNIGASQVRSLEGNARCQSCGHIFTGHEKTSSWGAYKSSGPDHDGMDGRLNNDLADIDQIDAVVPTADSAVIDDHLFTSGI